MCLVKQPYEVSKTFFLKALLYGQPGLGKSTAGASMPKPLLIDCDGGIHRLAPQHRPQFLPVQSYAEVLEVLASKEIEPFETIVFDTAGKLLDYMDAWIIKNNPKEGRKDGALTLQGYGTRKREFINLLKRISVMGKHLVFIAHEREERDGDTKIIRPEIGGSSGNDLIKELDLVGYMEAVGKKRTISFSPCEKYYAKNSARINDLMEIPELVAGKPNEFMTKIVDRCIESLNEESEIGATYDKLMKEIGKEINAVKDTKTANTMLKKLSEMEHIWDSKIKAWDMLQIRAGELSITFDKGAKAYVESKTAA